MSSPQEKLEEAIKVFNDEMGLDEKIYLRLLTNALADVFKDIESLRVAVKNNDFIAIQEISHRIKGVAGNMRLKDVLPIATELNDLSKKKEQRDRYLILFDTIEKQLKDYQESLRNKT